MFSFGCFCCGILTDVICKHSDKSYHCSAPSRSTAPIRQAYHSYLAIGTQFHKMWATYGHSELGFMNLVLHCVTDSCNQGFNLGLVLVCWKYYNAMSCSVLPASSFGGRKIHELNLVSSGRHWYWLGQGRSKDLYRIFYKYWWSFFSDKILVY